MVTKLMQRIATMALTLACVAPWSYGSVRSATIYSDDFSGTGPLNGAVPDARPGAEIWRAAEVYTADGAVSTARGKAGYTYQAVLPFVPESGRVYAYSLDVDPSTAGNTDLTQWFAMGFTSSDSTAGADFYNTGVAWALHRISRSRTENDELQTFVGPAMANPQSHPSKQSGKVTLTVLLDTTASQWTVEWLRNGASIRGPVAYTINPAITCVGFAKIGLAGGTVDNFELKLTGPTALLPGKPTPADKAMDVLCDAALSWEPGVDAVTHDVYLGTVLADVTNASRSNPLGVLVSQNQDVNAYDPAGRFAYGQVYYWRVDEVTAGGSIAKGPVWQFTAEAKGLAVAGNLITATASSSAPGCGPEKTIDSSGLNPQDGHSTSSDAMWQSVAGATEPVWIQYAFNQAYRLSELWVWNYNVDLEWLVGFGLKDVKIEHSLDNAAWTTLGTFTFERGTSKPGYTVNTKVDFAGVAAQYVRLTVQSSWGTSGHHGLSEVRFFYLPTKARQPSPATGATGISTDVPLSWRAGREAVSHHVYLSSDVQVAGGTVPTATVGGNQYEALGLDLGTKYYWRVDEVNQAAAIPLYVGDEWNFTTVDFRTIDDFESYTDVEPACIYNTWVDGWGTSDNGGQAGNAVPQFAETVIVHGGKQSMPFSYGNDASKTFSEATRTFSVAQDWTAGSAQCLVVYFRGLAANTTGQLYLKINGVKTVYGGDVSDLVKTTWTQWTVDLSGIAADRKNVTKLAIGVDNGGTGTLYFDDIRLYRVAPK